MIVCHCMCTGGRDPRAAARWMRMPPGDTIRTVAGR